MITAYPLQFPLGVARTARPQPARFSVSLAAARDNTLHQLRLLGAENAIISSNVPLRQDGLPYGRHNRIADTGVAVYFNYAGGQRVLACDKWNTVEANTQAVARTVEAIRGMERWGVSEMLDRLFTGFAALPQAEPDWHTVLAVEPTAGETEIKRAYRERVKTVHPDAGGSEEAFRRVRRAYEQALARFTAQHETTAP